MSGANRVRSRRSRATSDIQTSDSDSDWTWASGSSTDAEKPVSGPALRAGRVFAVAGPPKAVARRRRVPTTQTGEDGDGFERGLVRADADGNRVLCDEKEVTFPRWVSVAVDAVFEAGTLGADAAAETENRLTGGAMAGAAGQEKIRIARAVSASPMVFLTKWTDRRCAAEFGYLAGSAVVGVAGSSVLGVPLEGVMGAVRAAKYPRVVRFRRNIRPYFPTEHWGGAMDKVFGFPGYGARFETRQLVGAVRRSSTHELRRGVTLGTRRMDDLTDTGRRSLHVALGTGNIGTAAWALRHGASIDAVDDNGMNIVHICAQRVQLMPLMVVLAMTGAAKEVDGGLLPATDACAMGRVVARRLWSELFVQAHVLEQPPQGADEGEDEDSEGPNAHSPGIRLLPAGNQPREHGSPDLKEADGEAPTTALARRRQRAEESARPKTSGITGRREQPSPRRPLTQWGRSPDAGEQAIPVSKWDVPFGVGIGLARPDSPSLLSLSRSALVSTTEVVQKTQEKDLVRDAVSEFKRNEDPFEKLGNVAKPEELDEWWEEGGAPDSGSESSALTEGEMFGLVVDGVDDTGSEPSNTSATHGEDNAPKGNLSPPTVQPKSHDSDSRKKEGEEGKLVGLPRRHGPETDWLHYAQALSFPSLPADAALLWAVPTAHGMLPIHYIAGSAPSYWPVSMLLPDEFDISTHVDGRRGGFRAREEHMVELWEASELVLLCSVLALCDHVLAEESRAEAGAISSSTAIVRLPLDEHAHGPMEHPSIEPLSQQLREQVGEDLADRVDARVPQQLLDDMLRRDHLSKAHTPAAAAAASSANKGLGSILEHTAGPPTLGTFQGAREEYLGHRTNIRTKAFFAARQESIVLLAAACGCNASLRRLPVAARERVRLLLRQPSERGWTALHLAAHRGRLRVLQMLLVFGLDPDSLSATGSTPLAVSITATHSHTSAAFLHNASVEAVAERGHLSSGSLPSDEAATGREDPVILRGVGDAQKATTQRDMERAWAALAARWSHVLRFPLAHSLGALVAVPEAWGQQAKSRALWTAMAHAPLHRVFRQRYLPLRDSLGRRLRREEEIAIDEAPARELHDALCASERAESDWKDTEEGWLWVGDHSGVTRSWLGDHGVSTVISILSHPIHDNSPIAWLPRPRPVCEKDWARAGVDVMWRTRKGVRRFISKRGGPLDHVAVPCAGAGTAGFVSAEAARDIRKAYSSVFAILRGALRKGKSVAIVDADRGVSLATAVLHAFFVLQAGFDFHLAAALLYQRHVRHAAPLCLFSTEDGAARGLSQACHVSEPVNESVADAARRAAARRGPEALQEIEDRILGAQTARVVLLRSPWLPVLEGATLDDRVHASASRGQDGSTAEVATALTRGTPLWESTVGVKRLVDAERLKRSRKRQGALLLV